MCTCSRRPQHLLALLKLLPNLSLTVIIIKPRRQAFYRLEVLSCLSVVAIWPHQSSLAGIMQISQRVISPPDLNPGKPEPYACFPEVSRNGVLVYLLVSRVSGPVQLLIYIRRKVVEWKTSTSFSFGRPPFSLSLQRSQNENVKAQEAQNLDKCSRHARYSRH